MDKFESWTKMKSSGTFRRKVKQQRNWFSEKLNNIEIIETQDESDANRSPIPTTSEAVPRPRSTSPDHIEESEVNADHYDDYFSPIEDDEIPNEDDDIPNEDDATHQNEMIDIDDEPLDDFLRKWSIKFNIRQYAMNALLKKLHRFFKTTLPTDVRSLMRKYNTI